MPAACRRTEWIIVSWVSHSVNFVCRADAPTSYTPELTNNMAPRGSAIASAIAAPKSR
jgi:hypothetical protein